MFDSSEELLNKIRLGEDSLLELKNLRFQGNKILDPTCDLLADELAAFANTNEGVLILGIDDKTREIEGIPLEKLDTAEDFVRGICTDSVKPPLFVRIFRLELPDSQGVKKPLLKIDIPRSLFVHRSPGGYFMRQGRTKTPMPTWIWC